MEYTIQKLAKLANISSRTLRYYDEIDLLKPARINSSGYRIYGQKEVNQLQQILFYRELGVSLEQIKSIISDPNFNPKDALNEHYNELINKRKLLDILIQNVEKTIANYEGRITMTDKEKFEGFKRNLIEENEKKYGKEIREKYGEDTVNASNAKLMNLTQEQYEELTNISVKILETLAEAMETGDPAGELAQQTAELHKQWLSYTWKQYTKEAHAGVAQMYVDDERFTAYYDDNVKAGAAKFLRDAIHIYTGTKK